MKTGPTTTFYILQNDALVSSSLPVVRLNDAAIVQGHGLFETIKVYQGRPFALSEHIERMKRGGEALGIEAPSLDEATKSINRLLLANEQEKAQTCRVRITLTGGVDAPSIFYQSSECPSHPETANVVTGNFVRNERSLLCGFKTLSYGENAVATRHVKAVGADEAIWTNTMGELCEGTWSNIFVRIEGGWKTPPLSSGCLPGVTREKLLSLARSRRIVISETPIELARLDEIEAAFLTSSIREIQPIASIDGLLLGDSGGPDIEILKRDFADLVASSL
ncbi:MAG: aminotransferase class IV [Verrucomicrobiales bacterium]|nr:aminotransferase class IV [Verrucomicrobiales bacterium]